MSTFLPFVPITRTVTKAALTTALMAIEPEETFTFDHLLALSNEVLKATVPGGIISYTVCLDFLTAVRGDLDHTSIPNFKGIGYKRRRGAKFEPFQVAKSVAAPSSSLEQAVMDLNMKIAAMLKASGVEPELANMADPVRAIEAAMESKLPGLPIQSVYKRNDGEVFCKVYGELPAHLIREEVLDTILKRIDVPVPQDATEKDKFAKVLDWVSSHRFTPNGNNVLVALAGWKDDEVGTRQVFGPDPANVDDLKAWITNAKRYAVETENLVTSVAKSLGVSSISIKEHFLEAIQRMRTQMAQDETTIKELQTRDLARGLEDEDSREDEVVAAVMDALNQGPAPNPFQQLLRQLDDRGTNLLVQPATYVVGGRIDLHDHFTFDCDGFDYVTLRTPVEVRQDPEGPESPFAPLHLMTNDLLVIVAWKASGLTNPHDFKTPDAIPSTISSGAGLTARPVNTDKASA